MSWGTGSWGRSREVRGRGVGCWGVEGHGGGVVRHRVVGWESWGSSQGKGLLVEGRALDVTRYNEGI